MNSVPALSRRALLAGSALAASACRRTHGSGYHGFLYAALAGSRSVAVVDLQAFAMRRSIPLACEPVLLAAHPDPQRAVAFAAGRRGDGMALVEALDLHAARSIAHSVVGPGEPILRKQVSAPALVWTAAGEPRLRAWRADNLQPAGTIDFAAPVVDFDLAVNTATKRSLACAALAGGLVQFADLASHRVSEPIRLSAELSAVRFRDDGRVVLAASRAAALLTAVDVESRRVMTELGLALQPDHLLFKPDGGQLFLTGEGRDAIVIVFPYHTEIAQTSLSGRHPGQMACSETPSYLFVSNPQAGSVTVFDIDTQKVVAVTGVGLEPGAIVVTPDQQYALVLNAGSGDVAVIRIPAIKPGRARRAALFTMIPVGGRPIAAVVRASA